MDSGVCFAFMTFRSVLFALLEIVGGPSWDPLLSAAKVLLMVEQKSGRSFVEVNYVP